MAVGKLFVDFEARTAKFEEKTKRARKSMGDFGKSAKGAGAQLGSVQGIVSRLLAPIAALSIATAGLGSTFENLRIKEKLDAQLKVATGSVENAKIAFADLSSTAGKMPNTLQEITREFIRLRNYGLKASEREILSYGNTAAAMGKSLNQMIEAVADATTLEFERLKEFGIKSRQEGDRVNFTFQGVTTSVKKSAEDIENYLRSLGEVQFAGSMAEQMDTIDGKVSTLSDSWFRFSTALGESGGMATAAKAAMGLPTVMLDAATLKLQEAKLDLENATIADLAVINALLVRNKATIAAAQNSGAPAVGNPYGYGGRAANVDVAAAREQNEKLKALKEELELKKQIKAEKAAEAAEEEHRAEVTEKLTAWEQKQRHKQQGILKTFAADHKKVMTEIYLQQEKLRKSRSGNVDAAIAELDALKKQSEELQKNYKKAKEEQDQARAAMSRHGNEWKNMRMNMREAFAEGIAGGKKLGDVLEDVLSIWARSMVMNMALGKLNPATGQRDGGFLDGIFGGSGGTGGILGGIGQMISGGRASGGSVAAGQLYRVNEGEGRREYFRPNVGGQVLPIGGDSSGVTINQSINVDARGADSGVAANLMHKLPKIIEYHALAAVRNEQRRRGL
jgi:hypothetical protein